MNIEQLATLNSLHCGLSGKSFTSFLYFGIVQFSANEQNLLQSDNFSLCV